MNFFISSCNILEHPVAFGFFFNDLVILPAFLISTRNHAQTTQGKWVWGKYNSTSQQDSTVIFSQSRR